jgi:HK97 family phage prohead protease
VSLSSALPVERWFGDEILEHTPEAINMERAARGLPVLFNHDTGTVVGRLINCGLRADGRFGGDLKFGRSSRAQEIRQDVVVEVLTDMSVGYRIDKWVESQRDGKDVYTATRWTPMEASIVPVPADHTVGINRSADRAAHPVINTRAPEQGKEQQMSENVPTPATAVVTSNEEPIAREEQRKLIAVKTVTRPWIQEEHRLRGPLAELFGTATFADLRIPFAVTAADLNSGEEIVLRDGIVAHAVVRLGRCLAGDRLVFHLFRDPP